MTVYFKYERELRSFGIILLLLWLLGLISSWLIWRYILIGVLDDRQMLFAYLFLGAIEIILLLIAVAWIRSDEVFRYEVTTDYVTCSFQKTQYRLPTNTIVGIKRKLTWSSQWSYIDFAIETKDGADHRIPEGFGLSARNVIKALRRANPQIADPR